MNPSLTPHRDTLLGIARSAIECGLQGSELAPDPERYAPELRRPTAVFVTLRLRAELRGCTGSLEAREALVLAVARAARRSAFADPRFAPLCARELDRLVVSISLLSPLEALPARCEAELLRALRPGRDGLVLVDGARSATFLPAVWQSLPDPRDFVSQLKAKAGLARDHWSPALRCLRYEAEEIA